MPRYKVLIFIFLSKNPICNRIVYFCSFHDVTYKISSIGSLIYLSSFRISALVIIEKYSLIRVHVSLLSKRFIDIDSIPILNTKKNKTELASHLTRAAPDLFSIFPISEIITQCFVKFSI
jgi:hypothetical protein